VAKDNIDKAKVCIAEAHVATNEKLHKMTTIDDTLSGTTAISVLFRGRNIFVNNVGDSRAIILSEGEGGKLVTTPLSSDQTPYRRDERERVKKYGARIMTIDQMEGVEATHDNWDHGDLLDKIDESGDPPRIWAPKGDYPGTAFTRSIGDRTAESLGVVAVPEILVR
jgi:serine/threonine protein phosphatase PrpC